ncbi:MAG: hypothetical protein IPP71_19730 [Bacteroidetes bacterium]|nr:hypothetical protein [Bacteroidota bacterium]
MKPIILSLIVFAAMIHPGCNNCEESTLADGKNTPIACSEDCKAKSKSGEIACKLTSPELQARKATVLSSLKAQVIEKKELKNGYAFKFPGNDKIVDELTEFVKTERECCDFFTFNISISGDKSEAWLELTGAEGTKDFIVNELEL